MKNASAALTIGLIMNDAIDQLVQTGGPEIPGEISAQIYRVRNELESLIAMLHNRNNKELARQKPT